jgi:hypothetical protein
MAAAEVAARRIEDDDDPGAPWNRGVSTLTAVRFFGVGKGTHRQRHPWAGRAGGKAR